MNAYDIIRKPILSERSYKGIAAKRYTFEVDKHATKTQIKLAIEVIYEGVKVDRVNTMVVRGKFKRQGKSAGYTPDFKKAIVLLAPTSKAISSLDSLAN